MADEIKWMAAQYPGNCRACGDRFEEGADIAYLDDEIVGYECCRGLGTETNPYMPHGKTAADRCNECFCVHSPGQTECE